MTKLQKVTIGLTTLACVSAAMPALATHNAPEKAVLLKGEFLTAYASCTVPNTTTSVLFPACRPPVRTDPTCGFASGGKGKFLVRQLAFGPDRLVGTSDDGDLTLQADLVGLETSCQGSTLTMALSLRMTLDDCAGQACSVVDLVDIQVAQCTVDAIGKCKIKTTLNTFFGVQIVLPGQSTSVGIAEVSMWNGPSRTFRGGVIVP